MPTMAHLADIAEYVYNTSNIAAYGAEYYPLDYDKVAELGFTAIINTEFSIWSSEEINSTDTYSRYFNSNNTIINGYDGGKGRSFSSKQAVCLGD